MNWRPIGGEFESRYYNIPSRLLSLMDHSYEYLSGRVTKVIEIESEVGMQVYVAIEKTGEQSPETMKTRI